MGIDDCCFVSRMQSHFTFNLKSIEGQQTVYNSEHSTELSIQLNGFSLFDISIGLYFFSFIFSLLVFRLNICVEFDIWIHDTRKPPLN